MNIVLSLLVMISVLPLKCFAISVDSSDLEARFGCSKQAILADLVNNNRHTNAAICSDFAEVSKLLGAANGNVEKAIARAGILDSEDNPYTDQCNRLKKAAQQFSSTITIKAVSQGDYLKCSRTRLSCDFNRAPLNPICGILNGACDKIQDAADKIDGNVVDFSCLREVFTNVADIKTSFSEQKSIGGVCREQTVSLTDDNDDIGLAFSGIEVDASTRTVDGVTTEFVEYKSSNSSSYKSICQRNGGRFVEINLRATCRGYTISSSQQSSEVQLVVANRPRCYGLDCTASDDVGLFEDYTLRDTEKLWEDQTTNTLYVCQGESTKGTISICREETAAIGEALLLRSTSQAIVPDVQQKQRSLLFFKVDISGEKVVKYLNATTEATAYQEACVNRDGEYSVADDFVLQCEKVRVGGKGRTEEALQFDMLGLPVCLGVSCTEAKDSAAAVALLGAEQLKAAGSLSTSDDYEWICTSGASALSSLLLPLVGAVAAFLSLF